METPLFKKANKKQVFTNFLSCPIFSNRINSSINLFSFAKIFPPLKQLKKIYLTSKSCLKEEDLVLCRYFLKFQMKRWVCDSEIHRSISKKVNRKIQLFFCLHYKMAAVIYMLCALKSKKGCSK